MASPMATLTLPSRANWRTQVDALASARERELVNKLAALRQEAVDVEREIAEIRGMKRLLGVQTEIVG